jgi:hypothetical protein
MLQCDCGNSSVAEAADLYPGCYYRSNERIQIFTPEDPGAWPAARQGGHSGSIPPNLRWPAADYAFAHPPYGAA